MGVFSDWFKNFNPMNLLGDLGSSALGALGAWFGQQSQYKYNKRLQDDAQDFNSSEAEKNRYWQTMMNRENNQFNAAQSELARQFQEDFYLKYQSPSAMMSQYKDAGLNPVLAAGQATNTPPSASSASAGSAPSGAAASSGMNGVGPMDLIGSIASIMKLKAEINNINADTEGKQAAAGASVAEAAYKTSLKAVTDEQVHVVKEQFRKLAAEATNEEYRQNILKLEKEILDYQAASELHKKEIRDKLGINGDESLWNMVVKMAYKLGVNIGPKIVQALTDLTFSSVPLDYTKQ